jgi:hypothetical protein
MLAAVLAGCGADGATRPVARDTSPAFELSDVSLRLRPEWVNAHMYGSFVVTSGSTGGVITSGRAHFPGHPPAGPGTCDNGLWINAQGKRTAGTPDRPHPHCYQPPSGINVVLEPISVCHSGLEDCPLHKERDPVGTRTTRLYLAYYGSHFGEITGVWVQDPKTGLTLSENTHSSGDIIVGYAIDASTIATTPRRVGWMVLDLIQFHKLPTDLLDDACALDDGLVAPCLNLVVRADYKPFAVVDGGVGVPGSANGFLWFTPASAPYNYAR